MVLVKKWCFLMPLVLLLMCYSGFAAAADAPVAAAPVVKCNDCHEPVVTKFAETHHAKAFQGSERTCTNCHGNADAHISAGDGKNIVSFNTKDKEMRKQLETQCLSCHNNTAHLAFWKIGDHRKNGVTCVDCHNIHVPAAQRKPTSQTCLQCHKRVKIDLEKSSHHPIIEGKVNCFDCHNPHGTTTKHQLNAPSTNQLCYKCHADKRGPFKWEHPPVEEDCLKCHTPHGSRHVRLLNKKTPSLCQDCHITTSHPSGVYGSEALSSREMGKSCVSCHAKIHGSNSAADGKALRQ